MEIEEEKYDRIQNLQNDNSEVQASRAKRKRGMTYYTTRLKEQFVKDKNTREVILGATKRINSLIKKSEEGQGLQIAEVKELAALSSITNKFLDKTFASQTENKNENTNNITPVVFMPIPDIDVDAE